MNTQKDFENTNTASWMYDQQKRQEKKQAKQMRNMKQGKKDHWNNMESV